MHKTIPSLTLSILISLLISSPLSSQETQSGRYTLTGDEVLIEVDDLGARHLFAEGNVHLTYIMDDDEWILTAGQIEFIEVLDEDGVPISQTAYAENDFHLAGPQITVTAAGTIGVDILQERVTCDSRDIHMVFPDGELVTDSLEFFKTDDVITINTAIRTVATYDLAESGFLISDEYVNTGGSIFGDLKFDFSTITLETQRTTLVIIDDEPYQLDCPDPTKITTAENILTMPSCTLTFNPRTLRVNDIVELNIGEDIIISAMGFSLSYPENGMLVELGKTSTNIADSPEDYKQVTITHPTGTFSADCITIEVYEDGTQRIHASGSACLEIPISAFEEITDTQD